MYIVCSIDNGYKKQLATTLFSLSKHIPQNEIITVYVMNFENSQLSPLIISYLRSFLKNNDVIVPLNVPKEIEMHLPNSDDWPKSVWFKAFAPLLLPNCVDRFLWLDADTLVINDFSNVYYNNYKDNVIIGCKDSFHKHVRDINDFGNNYLCAGVLIFDKKNFLKEIPSVRKLFESIKNYPYQYFFQEQDWLNYTFRFKKYCLKDDFLMALMTRDEGIPADYLSRNPAIIHYSGPSKPWAKNFSHYFFITYWRTAIHVFGGFCFLKILLYRPIYLYKKLIHKIHTFLMIVNSKKYHKN